MYDPKTPDMCAKPPPRRPKTKHVFYQNTATSSITYDFFHRNTLFSACITEKCNTEYSTEHKIQGKQTGIKRTDPYAALIASAPFPMRPRKKNTRPLCRTDMPDRNNKMTGFSGDTLQVFNLKPAAKKHGFFAPTLKQTGNYPKKPHHHAAFSKTFLLLSPKAPAFPPQKQAPR